MTDLQHITVPLVDPETGRATTVFYRYLRGLKRNVDDVGDDEAPPSFENLIYNLASDIESVKGQVDVVSQQVKDAEQPEQLLINIQEDLDSVAQELQQLNSHFIAAFKNTSTVITAANVTTANDSVVVCTAALTVTLNANPSDRERVTIKCKVAPVIIDGNSKDIDGDTTYTMLVDYEGIDLIYSATEDEWFKV